VSQDNLSLWVRSHVHVEVLYGAGTRTVTPGRLPHYDMGVAELEGLLTEVSKHGIILLQNNTDELFFSWNAVLMIRPSKEEVGWRG
jgi:hypothetical protein